MYAHYDDEVDIAWFLVDEGVKIEHSEEVDWGLVERDAAGRVIALEFWQASERLPAELIAALPPPKVEGAVAWRQPDN